MYLSEGEVLFYTTPERLDDGPLILPPHWNGEYDTIEIPTTPEALPDKCGVIGICLAEPDPMLGRMLKGGAKEINHRGQEAAGIAIHTDDTIIELKGLGLVDTALEESKVNALPAGQLGIAQDRYGTVRGMAADDETLTRAAQPISRQMSNGEWISIAHNGDIPRIDWLCKEFGVDGSDCVTDTDKLSIIFSHVRDRYSCVEDMIVDVLGNIEGAYALIIAAEGKMVGIRDPYGFRPLMIGSFSGSRRGTALASESHAFPGMGAEFRSELGRGAMVVCEEAEPDNIRLRYPFERRPDKLCAMELMYLSAPYGLLKDRSIQMVRESIGRQLARECPAPNADFVVGIPESGIPAGEGFAAEAGIRYEHAVTRRRDWARRNFITPGQLARTADSPKKNILIMPKIFGRSGVVVDDSLFRGTTTKAIIEQFAMKGARELYLRICAPMVLNPCFMGLDTGVPDELLANIMKGNIEKMIKYIKGEKAITKRMRLDLGFLSIDGLNNATNAAGKLCMACMDGNYPIEVPYPRKKIRYPNGVVYEGGEENID